MNKYDKILKCMDVDAQNLPLFDFQDAEGMVQWYQKQTDEMIERIYDDYYGTEEEQKAEEARTGKEDFEEYVLMIVGDINFPNSQATDEYWDKILVNQIDHILFVPKDKVGEIGEEFLASGSDGYLVPSMTSEEIHSPNHWYLFDDITDNPVVIDPQMQVAVGFTDTDAMKLAYPFALPITYIDGELFQWHRYDHSVDKNGKGVEKKNPFDCHQRALAAVGMAHDIVTNNGLYQNLYRCEEALGCLKHDDELWKMVMNKVITIIQDEVEPHNKS